MTKLRLLLPLAVALAVALAAPSVARGQIIRDGSAATASTSPDSLSPLEFGRRAQVDFERFRKLHLQWIKSTKPTACDETVGNFCYWYNDHEPVPPKEPADVSKRRDALTSALDSLAKLVPTERWFVAQRVRYHAEAARPGRALEAANDCKIGGWFCGIMVGFALHELGEYRTADSVYAVAISKMLPRDQCRWRDLGMLIDDDTRQQYRRLSCGDPARQKFEDRVWLLSRVLYSMSGNDSRTEWYARMTYIELMRDAPSIHQLGSEEDEKELLLRFGWPRMWGQTTGESRTDPNVVGMEAWPAYRFIPAGFVLNNPPISDSTNWALQLPPVIARYAPVYAKTLKPLVHQKAMFRRGDTAYVVMAYDAGQMKELAEAKLQAALVVMPNTALRNYSAIERDAGETGVLTAKAPWGPLIMSAEVTAPGRAAVGRARYGVSPPFAVGTRVTLSDLLFYKPFGDLPTTVEEASPHALTTERVRSRDRLGVYWETYGTDPTGEGMKISLTVVKEVEETGFLRRQAQALKLSRQATPVSVSVQDVSARGTSTSTRAIELDISTLTKGSYIVQLEVEVAGQYVIRADHRIEIIPPDPKS